MNLSIIPNWRYQNLKCHFCKNTESVKYKTIVFEENEEKEVCCCNKCAFDKINNKTGE